MPTKPNTITIEGSSNSVVGDTIRITVYTGDTARGTVTGVLDSNKRLIVDLAESISYSEGDTVVATEYGKALGGSSATIDSGGSDLSITGTTVAFPSRSL